MRKDFGVKTWFYPLPVVIIGTYDENGVPNAMNAAWSGIWDYNQVYVSLSKHKTTDNLTKTRAFTISFADVKHVVEADCVGVVSGNQVPNKLEIAGLHTHKSAHVNAPIIDEFPLTLECNVVSFEEGTLIGEIVNVNADESVLTNGVIDVDKLQVISFSPADNSYRVVGKKVGNAFRDGLKLK
ncbi:MAG: flavin reductase family protein [Clostridia bacterium]|nr:flavin reductase family protein [Clostridia bacterium]